jgi:hypothetical protein
MNDQEIGHFDTPQRLPPEYSDEFNDLICSMIDK